MLDFSKHLSHEAVQNGHIIPGKVLGHCNISVNYASAAGQCLHQGQQPPVYVFTKALSQFTKCQQTLVLGMDVILRDLDTQQEEEGTGGNNVIEAVFSRDFLEFSPKFSLSTFQLLMPS